MTYTYKKFTEHRGTAGAVESTERVIRIEDKAIIPLTLQTQITKPTSLGSLRGIHQPTPTRQFMN